MSMRLAISSLVGSRPSSCTSWRLVRTSLLIVSIMCTGMRDGARLVGNGSGNGLANPPRRVGRKLVAAAPLELVHGLHQADVAFLNQVEKLQSAVGVFLGDGNNQAQVGFDQFFLGLLGFRFAAVNERQCALQFLVSPTSTGFLDVFQLGAARAAVPCALLPRPSPLATSARRSSRPDSRSSDCSRSTVPRILSISQAFSRSD